MSNKIHIANNTNQEVLVMIAPNKDFFLADVPFSIAVSAAVSAATGGAGTPVAAGTVTTLAKAIKTAKDIYTIFGMLKKAYKVADAAAQKNLTQNMENVMTLFREASVKVPAGSCIAVNEKDTHPFDRISTIPHEVDQAIKNAMGGFVGGLVTNQIDSYYAQAQIALKTLEFINPSVFMSNFGFVGDLSIFIATPDFKKFTVFNTNSDHSWVVNDNDIVRAKYGKLWEQDRNAGWHIFSNGLGASIEGNFYLSPYDSLDIQTKNFDGPGNFMPDMTINVVKVSEQDKKKGFWSWSTVKKGAKAVQGGINTVVKKSGELIEGVANAPSNAFSYPYKLVYQPDGNLVLYHIKGDNPKPVWDTKTSGKPAWRVYMQPDGNLVVYSAPGKVEWALFSSIPSHKQAEYANAYIALHGISGKIGYYKKGKNQPEFYVNEAKVPLNI